MTGRMDWQEALRQVGSRCGVRRVCCMDASTGQLILCPGGQWQGQHAWQKLTESASVQHVSGMNKAFHSPFLQVIQRARKLWTGASDKAGLLARVEFVEGSFFDSSAPRSPRSAIQLTQPDSGAMANL